MSARILTVVVAVVCWPLCALAGEGPNSGWREPFGIVRQTNLQGKPPRYLNVEMHDHKPACRWYDETGTAQHLIGFPKVGFGKWVEGQIVFMTNDETKRAYLVADVSVDPPILSFSPKQRDGFAWKTKEIYKTDKSLEFYIGCTTKAGNDYWLQLEKTPLSKIHRGEWRELVLSRDMTTAFVWKRYWYADSVK